MKKLKFYRNQTRLSGLISALLINLIIPVAQTVAQDTESSYTEIIIKGVPFEAPLKEVPTSASVLEQPQIAASGTDHFQNVIEQIPNFNWAGGTSRPRFFQIRGIGELEQYEGAPNPSVGVFIDDIDLSGIGGVATLFDVDQVEVLRGPQSIRYGANSLAGTLSLHSTDPSPFYSGRLELGGGSDEMYEGGAAVGGPLDGTGQKLLFRVSAYHHYNDGFRDNPFLSRDDTNKREESTFRGKLSYRPGHDFSADLSVFGVDINNGYDAFAIDNSFTTFTDQPGQDIQQTVAGALKLRYRMAPKTILESISSVSDTDTTYSFDGDWGNNEFWEPFAPYDFFSETFRDRGVYSQELRLHSDDPDYEHGKTAKWLAGVFVQRLDEDTDLSNYQDKVAYDRLISDYRADTVAAFGQYELPLRKGTSLTAGLRAERRKMEYLDNREGEFNPTNEMLGGSLSLNQDINEAVRAYILASRGFKGGGFNANPNAPVERREYSPEYLWNFEAGIKSLFLEKRLSLNTAAFYAERDDVQVKLALQTDPTDPLTFLFLTDNAAGGSNYGLETDMIFKVNPRLEIFASGALLNTEFNDFEFSGQTLDGRQQSHAPSWQYSAGPQINLTENIFTRLQISGKDSFYFDDSHNEKSSPYHLVNLSAGYRESNWSLTFWVRNLFDEEYAVRGFFFGNEPPDFEAKRYLQLGDPRRIGATFSYNF